MALNAPKSEKIQRELVPEGNHPARIYEVIELGTVESKWNGNVKMQHKVRISFEFPTKKFVFNEEKGPQPFVLSTEVALSMYDKATLRKIVDAVEGRKLTDEEADSYDVLSLAGKPLLVTVSHSEPNKDDIQYANATTFSPVIEGLTVAPLYNPIRTLEYGAWNEEVFQSLPQFLREKMEKTKEYQDMKNGFVLPKMPPLDDGSVKDTTKIDF